MADIPGLIRGASDGAGLGSRFLRHIQRTAVLLYVLAPSEDESNDLLQDFEDLRKEVGDFDPALSKRPFTVALNKADLPAARAIADDLVQSFSVRGSELSVISAATRQGLDMLKKKLFALVTSARAEIARLDTEGEHPFGHVPED
jgi:GTP-binding protein